MPSRGDRRFRRPLTRYSTHINSAARGYRRQPVGERSHKHRSAAAPEDTTAPTLTLGVNFMRK